MTEHIRNGWSIDKADELVIQARHLAVCLNETLGELAKHGIDCRAVEDLWHRDPGSLRTNCRVSLTFVFHPAKELTA